jgi:hypothetical protein
LLSSTATTIGFATAYATAHAKIPTEILTSEPNVCLTNHNRQETQSDLEEKQD